MSETPRALEHQPEETGVTFFDVQQRIKELHEALIPFARYAQMHDGPFNLMGRNGACLPWEDWARAVALIPTDNFSPQATKENQIK